MFRFTIRDVLWLTVMVALAVGWWLDRSRLATDNQQQMEWVRFYDDRDFPFRADSLSRQAAFPDRSGGPSGAASSAHRE
jgi:hypothetical protein